MDVNPWNLTDVRIQLQTVPELLKILAWPLAFKRN